MMGVFTDRLYNLQDHTEIGTLVQHDGNPIFSHTYCHTPYIYIYIFFFAVAGTITNLQFFGGSHLVSTSEDQTICIWECGGSWECLHVLKGHK